MNDEFDYIQTGAELLGKDLSKLLNERTSEIVSQILSEKDEDSGLYRFADVIVTHGNFPDSYEIVFRALQKIRSRIINN